MPQSPDPAPSANHRRQLAELIDKVILDSGLSAREISRTSASNPSLTLSNAALSDFRRGVRVPDRARLEVLFELVKADQETRDHTWRLLELIKNPIAGDRRRRRWMLAASVALAVVGLGVVVVLVVPSKYLSPEMAAQPTQSSEVGGDTEPRAEDSPCPTPTTRAESKKDSKGRSRANAEYCADRHEFLLADTRTDGKSAILVVRVNGQEQKARFNSNGHEAPSSNGQEVEKVPAKPIPMTFGPNDTAEFKVCVGPWNPERNYDPDSCGEHWTPILPRR